MNDRIAASNSDNAKQRSANRTAALAYLAGGLCLISLTLVAVGMISNRSEIATTGGAVLCLAMTCGLFVAKLAGFRFTLWILIANLAALLTPQWFISIGGFSLTDPWLLLIVVQLIMFGMATQMSIRDFGNVIRMPGTVCVGLVCQFMIMPLLGYTLATSFRFPPEIGAGLVLIGSCSSGLTSNVMTYLARGNLALSVTLTALATAAAPIVTPLWMRVLAGSMVEVDVVKMSLDIIKIVLVPIFAAFVHDFLSSPRRSTRIAIWALAIVGSIWLVSIAAGGWNWIATQLADQPALALNLCTLPGFIAAAFVFGTVYHYATQQLPQLIRWMPIVSMLGIIYFTLVATAQGRDQLLAVGLLLVLATILHNLLGYCIGYWASRAMGLCKQDARTVAIEVGSQNGAMATGLAKGMDKLGTVGLAAVIFAPLMNVTGSIIANHWQRTSLEIENKNE